MFAILLQFDSTCSVPITHLSNTCYLKPAHKAHVPAHQPVNSHLPAWHYTRQHGCLPQLFVHQPTITTSSKMCVHCPTERAQTLPLQHLPVSSLPPVCQHTITSLVRSPLYPPTCGPECSPLEPYACPPNETVSVTKAIDTIRVVPAATDIKYPI